MAVVGWVGLGKLGAPCAAALVHHGGHEVVGYDLRGPDGDYDWASQRPATVVKSITEVVDSTDNVVFVAVQTPHAPEYGGETTLRGPLVDFEYQYLVNAVREVCAAAREQTKNITLVVVSTVLPGTFNARLRSLLNEFVTPVYHPFFIAMGTVVDDFIGPEMTLFGVDHLRDADPVLDLYASLHSDERPAPTMSIPSAELTKVAYNTFITAKIVFANTLMELAEHTGADVDEVTDALALGTDRIISPSYMRAGMGDGGACHPRDNIALAALAEKHMIRGNYFHQLIRLREQQSDYLASLVEHWTTMTGLPVVILGRAYKANLAMDAGSPALLLADSLRDLNIEFQQVDPVMDPDEHKTLTTCLEDPHVYFLATLHTEFSRLTYPPGSVVIDPFGFTWAQSGVTFVTPGRRQRT